MNSILKVVNIQYSIVWENAFKNRTILTQIIEEEAQADIYVLPETFSTGFSIKEEIAERMEGDTVVWMQKMAKQKQAAIVGSLIIKEHNNFYNRLLFVSPNGEIKKYDKQHLFNYGNEGKCFTAGKTTIVFEYLGWKIKPIICYDLRFPVAIRNTENYDLLLCIANWPSRRIEAWDALLKARAIENQVYVIAVNRIGVDGNKLEYSGHSNVYDPLGNALGVVHSNFSVTRFNLSKKEINVIREKFPFLEDRDQFNFI